MRKSRFSRSLVTPAILAVVLLSCQPGPPKTDVAANVEDLNERVGKDLNAYVTYFTEHTGKVKVDGLDSVRITHGQAVRLFYQGRNFRAAWSDTGRLSAQADTMLNRILGSVDDGLDPTWYHGSVLDSLTRQITADPSSKKDAVKWSLTDLLLTDAFMRLAGNLRFGLLPPDSISQKKDSVFSDSTLVALLRHGLEQKRLGKMVDSLRPQFPEYRNLSLAMHRYRKNVGNRHWDTLPKQYTDTAVFEQMLGQRLLAGGILDSTGLRSPGKITAALKAFQRSHALYPDGVPGPRTISALNQSSAYRLRQIGVNLERWRHRVDSMPTEYVWVNIPSYTLKFWSDDTLAIRSRVIVGKPDHQTPLLNSRITNFQLYPYWRVPISIIAGEMLPAIRRDTGYLRSHNLEVVDRHNNVVDPSKLKWQKYNRNYFPYVIRQMTGLDNSLGIIKFNFANKYSVYLHDTNLRNLFNLTNRDLSHGCIRVQEWQALAKYLIRNDTLRHLPDSVGVWFQRQEQKLVSLKTRVPVYIRYFTCGADSQGNLTFYNDIYGYDTLMMHRMY